MVFNNKLYAAIINYGIYQYNNGKWIKQPFMAGKTFNLLKGSANKLYIAEGTNLWQLNAVDEIMVVADPLISMAQDVTVDDNGRLFIADKNNGLVSNMTGAFTSSLPNGPVNTASFRLKYLNKKIFAAPASSGDLTSLNGNKKVDVFSEGTWQSISSSLENITDFEYVNNQIYFASYGNGVEQRDDAGNNVVFNESNSTFTHVTPPKKSINVSALSSWGDELYATNYGSASPLHKLKNNVWSAYAADLAGRYPTTIATDFYGNVWMANDPSLGGGITIIPKTGNNIYKTGSTGAGALPSPNVRCITLDRDGYVWVGTDEGVAYFFSPTQDAIKPIFENRFLLRDEVVTSIAIDGGNRKWIGTTRGAWLVGPTGETLIYNFTAENSPLLSNTIRSIAINQESGEVFFSTDKGIVSFRADATTSESGSSLKIFPNPVTSNFNGTVGITGLSTDAIVKITDISGKLIWQTQANGGTATWNVRDYNGRHAATGVYIVFASTTDGTESMVGKIAVIE